MTKPPPPIPPLAASPDNEPNKSLAKYKQSLSKRWSVTKRETLYEIADLAIFLWALERSEEAVAVAAAVATAVPVPPPLPRDRVNYNLWCPATFSHALVMHLGGAPMSAQVARSRATLLADAGIARDNPEFLEKKVAEARERLEAAHNPKELKWELLGLARSIGTLNLYSELASAGDPIYAPHKTAANDLIPLLLSKLSTLLRSKA